MKTVSNVINDFPHVSAATRDKVRVAIRELGYRPNFAARHLASGRTGVIALVVPQIDMPYFASLSMHVIAAAEAVGWVVVLQQTFGSLSTEREILQGRFPQPIDGLIFNPLRLTAKAFTERADRTPLVLVGERPYRGVADHVAIDNERAAREAVEHLLGTGRRRIAMIGVAPGDRQNLRLRGYRSALAGAGLEIDPRLVAPAPHNVGEEGETAMLTMLDAVDRDQWPDAVFCTTDWVALGVLRALQGHGVRVPEDVAVVGFDDIPYGRVASPSLTTIAPDRAAIARTAVESLRSQLADPGHLPTRELAAPYRLVVRESSGPATPLCRTDHDTAHFLP